MESLSIADEEEDRQWELVQKIMEISKRHMEVSTRQIEEILHDALEEGTDATRAVEQQNCQDSEEDRLWPIVQKMMERSQKHSEESSKQVEEILSLTVERGVDPTNNTQKCE